MTDETGSSINGGGQWYSDGGDAVTMDWSATLKGGEKLGKFGCNDSSSDDDDDDDDDNGDRDGDWGNSGQWF